MSDQNVEQKCDLLQRKKRKVKRKAKSPLNDTNNGDTNGHTHSGSGTQVSSRKGGVKGKTVSCVDNKNINSGKSNNKNRSSSKSSGFCFPDPSKNPPIMSFTQGTVNQQMQQPVGQAQGISGLPSAACINPALYSSQALSPSQQMFNMPQHQATGPPGWVSELIEDVKQIKLSMTKLDQIERTVNMINMKVSDLKVKVNHIEPRVTEVEKSCSFIGRENDDRKKELEKARSEMGRLRTECTNMQSDANVLKMKNAALEAKVTDLESRSMRDNLLFYGITERGQHENCEGLVKEVCLDTLGLQDAENMT